MQVGNVGSVILLQACISFVNLISRITVKDIDSTCVVPSHLLHSGVLHASSSFLLLMYGSRASEAVLSSRKHNDLLVFEQQVWTPNGFQACCLLTPMAPDFHALRVHRHHRCADICRGRCSTQLASMKHALTFSKAASPSAA